MAVNNRTAIRAATTEEALDLSARTLVAYFSAGVYPAPVVAAFAVALLAVCKLTLLRASVLAGQIANLCGMPKSGLPRALKAPPAQATRVMRAGSLAARRTARVVMGPYLDSEMLANMLALRHHFQILGGVVAVVAVAMVNHLIGQEIATQRFFRNKTMLCDQAITVASWMFGAIQVNVAARRVAFLARPFLSPLSIHAHASKRAVFRGMFPRPLRRECLAADNAVFLDRATAPIVGMGGILGMHRDLLCRVANPRTAPPVAGILCALIIPFGGAK